MKIKVTNKSLQSIFMITLVYHMIFLSFPFISSYTTIQRIIAVFILIILIPKINYIISFLKKDSMKLLLCHFGLIMVSALVNNGNYNYTKPIWNGATYVLCLIEVAIIFFIVAKQQGAWFIINTLFWLTLIYVVLNDIFIIVKQDLFFTSLSYYFLGNKFGVSYRHLELIALFLLRIKVVKNQSVYKINNMYKLLMIIALSFFIILKVNSTTGILAILSFTLFYFFIPYRLVFKRYFYCILLFGSTSFAFIYEYILSIPAVQYFIVDILNESLNLTGRIYIFEKITMLLKNHLMLGYGYGTSYEIWTSFTVYPNSQNGLIDCILEQGILSVIFLIIFATMCIRNLNKHVKNSYVYKPLLAIIFTYTLLSSIEITIGRVYVTWLILIAVIVQTYRDLDKNKIDKGKA